ELNEAYDIPVLARSAENMNEEDAYNALREALYEFPVLEVNVNLPSWVMVLAEDHWLKISYQEAIQETVKDIKRLRDVDRIIGHFSEYEFIETAKIHGVDMGEGIAEIDLDAPNHLYDQVLKEIVGEEITGKDHLLRLMQDFAKAKKEYDQISEALAMVKQTGYGVAAPSVSDMTRYEP